MITGLHQAPQWTRLWLVCWKSLTLVPMSRRPKNFNPPIGSILVVVFDIQQVSVLIIVGGVNGVLSWGSADLRIDQYLCKAVAAPGGCI